MEKVSTEGTETIGTLQEQPVRPDPAMRHRARISQFERRRGLRDRIEAIFARVRMFFLRQRAMKNMDSPAQPEKPGVVQPAPPEIPLPHAV